MARDQDLVFLFPSDYFHPKQPDEAFFDQAKALLEQGFGVAVISLEGLESGQANILPTLSSTATVVYRGWMLNADQYAKLLLAIKRTGATPLTSLEGYLACHHLPNWYPLLTDLTPETRIFALSDDFKTALNNLDWDGFFVKDFVKSLKTLGGSVISRADELAILLQEMQHFRSTIEGGLCVRRIEPFLPETEQRFFVLHQHIFSPTQQVIPEIVQLCAERMRQPFFSVDMIRRSDGVLRIVEIGDGQVSDLVGWTPKQFATIWQHG